MPLAADAESMAFFSTSWTATLPMLADEVEEVGKAFAARWRPCA